MKISEILAVDAFKPQLDRIKKTQHALKVRKAAVRAQQAQQQLRATQAPAKP